MAVSFIKYKLQDTKTGFVWAHFVSPTHNTVPDIQVLNKHLLNEFYNKWIKKNAFILNTYYELDSILGSEDTVMDKLGKIPVLMEKF